MFWSISTIRIRNEEDIRFHLNQVIVDAPPLSAGPEVAVAASFAGAILMVIQAGNMSYLRIRKAHEALQSARCDVIGTLLTRAGSSRPYYEENRDYEAEETLAA